MPLNLSFSHATPAPRRHQHGVGLVDGLVALTLLGLGAVSLARMQANLISQGSEAQVRLVAARQADELLSLARVDGVHAGCYALPTPADCIGTPASAYAAAWKASTLAALPTTELAPTATVTLVGATGRLSALLTWPGKSRVVGTSTDSPVHQLEMSTDVSL